MEATVHGGTGPSTPVGRAAELALIATFVREAAGTGAALVMTGEPGSGKTLLLNIAAEMAATSGTVVLRANGVAVQAASGFSGLGQVLRPLMPHLPELAQAHRRAARGHRRLHVSVRVRVRGAGVDDRRLSALRAHPSLVGRSTRIRSAPASARNPRDTRALTACSEMPRVSATSA